MKRGFLSWDPQQSSTQSTPTHTLKSRFLIVDEYTLRWRTLAADDHWWHGGGVAARVVPKVCARDCFISQDRFGEDFGE